MKQRKKFWACLLTAAMLTQSVTPALAADDIFSSGPEMGGISDVISEPEQQSLPEEATENATEEELPPETVPEETVPEETVPEEIVPEETVPEEPVEDVQTEEGISETVSDVLEEEGEMLFGDGNANASEEIFVTEEETALDVKTFWAAAPMVESETTALTEDAPMTVDITETGDTLWYSFTPKKTALYCFSTLGSYDTVGELYLDSEGECLKRDDDNDSGSNIVDEESGASTGNNFRLEYSLQAGTTYYLAVSILSQITGSFSLTAEYVSKSVQSMEFVNQPKLHYFQNADSNINQGGILSVRYTDGSTEEVRLKEKNEEGFQPVAYLQTSTGLTSYIPFGTAPGSLPAEVHYLDGILSYEVYYWSSTGDYTEYTPGQTQTVEAEHGAGIFHFTVPTSGDYYFKAFGRNTDENRTQEYLRGHLLADGESVYNSSNQIYDYYGTEGLFCIKDKRYLEAGTDYIWMTEYHGGTYQVSVSSPQEIKVGQKLNFTSSQEILTPYQQEWRFIPEQTGMYILTMNCLSETNGLNYPSVYDENDDYADGEDYGDVFVEYQPDTGLYQISRRIAYNLTAGKAYRFELNLGSFREVSCSLETMEASAALTLENPVQGTSTGSYQYYSFTPSEDGYYLFETQSDTNAYYRLVGNDYNNYYSSWEWDDQTEGMKSYCSVWLEQSRQYQLGVSFDNNERPYCLSVSKPEQPTQLILTNAPDKTEYMEGEGVSYEGIQVKAVYADGFEEILTYNMDLAETRLKRALDFSSYGEKPGTYTVTVSYGTASAEFELVIKPDIPTENITELEAGVSYEVEIQSAGEVRWFSYTPSADGTYTIYSSDISDTENHDTFVDMYSREESIGFDDDSGSSMNFRLTKTLRGKQTYYYKVRMLSSNTVGKFKVHFEGQTDYTLSAEEGENAKQLVFSGSSLSRQYTYTPSESGVYRLWTEGNLSLNGGLYQEEDEKFLQSAYQDDSGNAVIKAYLEAGQTYSYRLEVQNNQTGSATLYFDQVNAPVSAEVTARPKTIFYTWEDDLSFHNLAVTLGYEDGSKETVSYNYRNASETGACLSVETPLDIESEDGLKEGDYTITVSCLGRICTYSVSVRGNAALEQLELEKAVEKESGETYFYNFTPSENGSYTFYMSEYGSAEYGYSYGMNFDIQRNGKNLSYTKYSTEMYGTNQDTIGYVTTCVIKLTGGIAYRIEAGCPTYSDNPVKYTLEVVKNKALLPGMENAQLQTSSRGYDYYTVTPEESGYYILRSKSQNTDSWGYNCNFIEVNSLDSKYSSNNGYKYNWISVYLTEGVTRTVYYKTGYKDETYTLSLEKAEPLTLETGDSREADSEPSYAYYVIRPEQTGFYTINTTSEGDDSDLYWYLKNSDGTTKGSFIQVSGEYDNVKETYQYAHTASAQLEEGKEYLLCAYVPAKVSYHAELTKAKQAAEITVEKQPVQNYYYKLDNLTRESEISAGSAINVTYTDNISEIIQGGEQSIYTGMAYSIFPSADEAYNSKGYLMPGNRKAVLSYLGNEVPVPIEVKGTSAMPKISLSDTGSGSRESVVENENGSGWVMFLAPEDGFYELTFSVDKTTNYPALELYNYLYSRMDVSFVKKTAGDFYQAVGKVYVRKGLPCYIHYGKLYDYDTPFSRYMLTVEKSATRNITELTLNEKQEVVIDQPGEEKWYSYTPDKSGTYYISTRGKDAYPNAYIYSYASPDAANSSQSSSEWVYHSGLTCDCNGYNTIMRMSLTEGTKYYFKTNLGDYNTSYTGSYDIQIAREQKAVKLELLTQGIIYCSNLPDYTENSLADLEFLVTYEDGTTETLKFGYENTESTNSDRYLSNLGYNMSYDSIKWQINNDGSIADGEYIVKFRYMEASVDVPVTACSIAGLDDLAGGKTVTIDKGKYSYLKFTPDAAGYYRVNARADEVSANLDVYDQYMSAEACLYENRDGNTNTQTKIYKFEAEQSYCVRLSHSGDSGAAITCSVEQISPVNTMEIETQPQTSYYYGVDRTYRPEGLSVKIVYEDGNTEVLAYGDNSEITGLKLETSLSGGNEYFTSAGSSSVIVAYMGATASYDIQVSENTLIPVMTVSEGLTGSLENAQQGVYAQFLAPSSGYYRVSMTAEDTNTVPYFDGILNDSYAQAAVLRGNYNSETGDLVAEETQYTRNALTYFLGGKTYFISGHLESEGQRVAGGYKLKAEPVLKLGSTAVSGVLTNAEKVVYQISAVDTRYYQFVLKSSDTVSIRLLNAGMNNVLADSAAEKDTKKLTAKLSGGSDYLLVCTNSYSEANNYELQMNVMPDIEGITVLTPPDKQTYYAQLEKSIADAGLVIRILYADGTKEDVASGKASRWGMKPVLDTSTIAKDEKGNFVTGTQNVKVTYMGHSTTFPIEVTDFSMENAKELVAETFETVGLKAGVSEFYIFKPETTAEYRYYSRGETDTYGYIYDSSYNQLAAERTGEDEKNFSISADLQEGETYILRVRAYDTKMNAETRIKIHNTDAFTEVRGVILDRTELFFKAAGETYPLTATVTPEDAKDKSVTWTSSNDAVAAVDQNGQVTSGEEGIADVTVTTVDGEYTASCTVYVDAEDPELQAVYPDDGSYMGPEVHTMWIYAADNLAVKEARVTYTGKDQSEKEISAPMEIAGTQGVASVSIPLDEFVHGDKISASVVAVDAAGRTSTPIEKTYTVDKVAPGVSDAAGSFDEESLSVKLSWKGGMESDISGYSVTRVDEEGRETFVGSRTGYVNVSDYQLEDTGVENKDASYTYRITSSDKYGNVSEPSEVSVTVTRVNQAPDIVLECPATMGFDREYRFDLTKSSDDGSIESFTIDFGDGSEAVTGASKSYLHTYAAPTDAAETTVKEYTVTVTAVDNEGKSATLTKKIRVVNLNNAGILQVTVKDTNGKLMENAPVYFNMGENQVISYTDAEGVAEFIEVEGSYAVGSYVSGYLPVKKTVSLENGKTTNLILAMEEKALVEGTFESHKMTLDEIKDAGINLDNLENRHVVEYHVTLEYSTVNFYWADGSASPVTQGGHTYIPVMLGEEIVVILEIPVKTSFVKEFYDVNLYIINNASGEFSLKENRIHLNVPDGLTVMETTGSASPSADAYLDEIKGQTTASVNWILRGDKSGEYYLGADYSGILSDFNTPVTAEFTSTDPIKVYGVDNLKVTMQIPKSFTDGEFYYNLIMENTGTTSDEDMYLPTLDGAGELIQTMYHRNTGEDVCIDGNMPEILHAGEKVTKNYLITDQIEEQLKDVENYESYVFYFKRMWIEELSNYGIPLNIEFLTWQEMKDTYDSYRAAVPNVTAEDVTVEYGYGVKEAVLNMTVTTADENLYTTAYEWYDTDQDQVIGTTAALTVPQNLEPGIYHYHCTAIVTRKDNNNKAKADMQAVDFIVNPKTIELIWSGNEERDYDGTPSVVSAKATGLLDGDSCEVSVENGDAVHAGTHIAKAVAVSNTLYRLPETAECRYVIRPKTVGLLWNAAETRTYDGKPSNVTAEATELVGEDSCSVTVSGGDAKDAGIHTAQADSLSNTDYQLPEAKTKNYTILEAELTAEYTGEKIYYGTQPTLAVSVTGFVENEDADSLTGQGIYTAPSITGSIPVTVGEHTLTPAGGEAKNYTFSYVRGTLAIERRAAEKGADGQYVMNAPQGTNGWYNGDVTVTVNEGFVLGTTEEALNQSVLTNAEDTAAGNCMFYIKNTQTGEIFLQSVEQYKLDRTAPTMEVSVQPVADAAGVNTSQKVVVMPEDATSGVAEVHVTLGGEVQTLALEEEASDQTEIEVRKNDDGSYEFTAQNEGLYTIQVMDEAGNTSSNEQQFYRLSFNSNGGSTCDGLILAEGQKLGLLPVPERAGYTFISWKNENGDSVTSETVFVETLAEVTAEWRAIPATAPTVEQPEGANAVYGYAAGSAVLYAKAAPAADTAYTLSYEWHEVKADKTDEVVSSASADSSFKPEAGKAVGVYSYYCVVTAKRTDNGETEQTVTGKVAFTVTKKELKAAYVSETIHYGMTPVCAVAVTGFVNGETAETAAGYKAPVIAGEVPGTVGEHILTPSGGEAVNYTFACEAGILSIDRRDPAEGSQGQYTITGIRGRDYWYSGDVTIAPNTGFEIGKSETAFSTGSVSYTEETDSTGNQYTFYIRDTKTGEIYNSKTETVKIDKTAPIIDSMNLVPTAAGKMNTTRMLAVTAQDSLSTVAGVRAYSVGYGAEPVEAVWNEQTQSWDLTISAAGTYRVAATDMAGNALEQEKTFYGISFDSQNGSACADLILVDGEKLGTLPVPERTGYVFEGWYDLAGTEVTADTVYSVQSPLVITAKWSALSASKPTVTAGPDVQAVYGYGHGSVKLSVSAAAALDTSYTLQYNWYEGQQPQGTLLGSTGTGEFVIPAGKTVGTYSYYCIVTAMRNDNGQKAEVSATMLFTVEPKGLKIVWSGNTGLSYSGNPVSVTASAEGVIGNEQPGLTVTGGTETEAGTYTAKASVSNPNYKIIENETVTYTIAEVHFHKWGEYKTISEADVFHAETQTRYCTVCGASDEAKTVGSPLKATVTTNASSIRLKVKQATAKFTVTGLAKGDSIVSMKLNSTKYVKISKINLRKGSCQLKAQKRSGKAKLTIKLASGLKKVVPITVQKSTVKTTSIKGIKKKIILKKNKKQTLKPVIAPFTSQEKVTYTSSNRKVVSVSAKGVIRALRPGTAKITVKSGSKRVICTVKVVK